MAALLDQALALSSGERQDLAMKLMESFKDVCGSSAKPSKAKTVKDPSAPKRELKEDSQMQFVNKVVWPELQKLAEAEADPEVKKRIRGVSARTQVASKIWAELKDMDSDVRVGQQIEPMLEASIKLGLEAWLENPPAAKSSSASVASAGSKVSSSSSKKKLADMTEEEKAAFQKARGAASAAARAAKKAASAEVLKAEDEPTEDEDFSEQKVWVQKGKSYIRLENGLWDSDSGDWVGEWTGKAINTKAKEPEIEKVATD